MADNSGVDHIFECKVEDISRAVAIANDAKGRHAFILKSGNNFIDCRACLGSAMIG